MTCTSAPINRAGATQSPLRHMPTKRAPAEVQAALTLRPSRQTGQKCSCSRSDRCRRSSFRFGKRGKAVAALASDPAGANAGWV